MEKILLTGATGQVGHELRQTLQNFGTVIPTIESSAVHYNSEALIMDLADSGSIAQVIREVKPTLIVNAAAYTAVDKAEEDFDLAMQINGTAPGIIAEEAKVLKAGLIHYSTDYVYPGTETLFVAESGKTNPINAYGKSKLAGDEAIKAVGLPYWILRTSWVYGIMGNNFAKTILRHGQKQKVLSVVNDQIGAPTSARTLADITGMMISKGDQNITALMQEKGGIFHLVNGGETSWYGFAQKIFKLARHYDIKLQIEQVNPVTTNHYPTPAARPAYSKLSTTKLKDLFHLEPQHWTKALEASFSFLIKQL